MSTVFAPGAPRHSPTTIGWPGVEWILVVRPIFVSWADSHSAQRFVSALCSDFAETDGIRRNSKSSFWIRVLLAVKKSGMPETYRLRPSTSLDAEIPAEHARDFSRQRRIMRLGRRPDFAEYH